MRLYGFNHKTQCILSKSFVYGRVKRRIRNQMRLYRFYHKPNASWIYPSCLGVGEGGGGGRECLYGNQMRITFLSQKSMHNRLVRNWIKMRSRSSLYRDDLLTILQLLIPSWYRLQFKCTYRFNLLRSLVVNFLRVLIQVHVFNFTETLDGWHCLFSRHNFWVYLIDIITFLCRKTVYNYKTHSTLEFVLNPPFP